MNWKERLFYVGMIVLLLFALLAQGRQAERISGEQNREIAPAEVYRLVRSAPATFQVVDARSMEEFEEGHVPGAMSLAQSILTEDAALDWYKKTIIVTEAGDPDGFLALSREFKAARNMGGGMAAWFMARLPEQSGLVDTSAMARGPAG